MGEAIFILVLILLNGVFSMSEIALISARKSNLQSEAEKGNKASENAFKLASNPDKFLSSVQIGITLIGILTGLISGDRIADTFEWLTTLGISAGTAATLAKTIIVIIVTFLTILLGELVPETDRLEQSGKVSNGSPDRCVSFPGSPIRQSTSWQRAPNGFPGCSGSGKRNKGDGRGNQIHSAGRNGRWRSLPGRARSRGKSSLWET